MKFIVSARTARSACPAKRGNGASTSDQKSFFIFTKPNEHTSCPIAAIKLLTSRGSLLPENGNINSIVCRTLLSNDANINMHSIAFAFVPARDELTPFSTSAGTHCARSDPVSGTRSNCPINSNIRCIAPTALSCATTFESVMNRPKCSGASHHVLTSPATSSTELRSNIRSNSWYPCCRAFHDLCPSLCFNPSLVKSSSSVMPQKPSEPA